MGGGPEEKLPRDFGKYRLERKLATGGMAEIFLAHPLGEEDELLVIKRILPHLVQSSEFVSMFLDEARIAARLKHPHVVEIFDIGQVEGAYFIAMEYVHGEDIRRIYNQAYKLQRSLPLSHSIRVIAEAAEGLGYAHQLSDDLTKRALGVVHRDVSPQNILVTYEGRAKVVDFGIARAANKVNQTRAGVLKGKYSYMSPEQALGEEIDHRTDIFALGIILYETTTGTRLFKRHNELATLQAVIKCEVPPPSEALRGYPPGLEKVVLKALAKRREDRFVDGAELSAALFDFLRSSGLYVDPEIVAEFMEDLFSDRLEEEKTTGVPAFANQDEVGAEMEPTGTVEVLGLDEVSVEGLSDGGLSEEEIALADTIHRDRSGEIDSRRLPITPRSDTILVGDDDQSAPQTARAPGFADDFADADSEIGGGTIAEEDSRIQQIRDASIQTRAGRPDPALKPRAHAASEAEARPKEVPATILDPSPPDMTLSPEDSGVGRKERVSLPSDMLPTMAAQPVYAGAGPEEAETLAPERPERSGPVENTEHIVRAHRPAPSANPVPKSSAKPSAKPSPKPAPTRSPRPPARPPSSAVGAPMWLWAMILIAAVLIGFFVWQRRAPAPAMEARPEPTPTPAVAVSADGEVNIVTEPGARIWLGGQELGRAGEDGRAGPFAVPIGAQTITVRHDDRRFERSRTVEIRGDKIHEFEIRARQGFLKLAVAPWAKVTVDGTERGITPLEDILLDEGTHEVVLQNPDLGLEHRVDVRIEAGQANLLKVDLNAVGEKI